MFKITYGKPEKYVPSFFCDGFNYKESKIEFDVEKIEFSHTARGCLIEFPLEEDAQVYGFGLQLKGFNHKNRKLTLRVNSDPVAYTGDSHAPVPFFVTNKGYGMYFDTARYAQVYCGFNKKRKRTDSECNLAADNIDDLYRNRSENEVSTMMVEIPGAEGIDVYIIEGKNILDIVSQYNMLSGGGCRVPEWGLGVLYRAFTNSTQKDIERLADYFLKNDIAVDILGLEPGWQSKSYSCSYVWDKERYPDYKQLADKLTAMGYHINLWEHAFVNSLSPMYEQLYNLSGDCEVWQGLVPDFGLSEARRIFSDYHKNNLVDLGIDGFKLDECDGSDFVASDWSFPDCVKFPSGLDGEQYHSLFGTLYMKTVMRALGGKETLSEVRNAGALASAYPFVLYSDLYDHGDFIRGVANSGFSGLLWTPEVRDAESKKDFVRRLQTNVFSVQCVINAWYLEKAPWLEYDCEDEVRDLLKVRHSLVPMLKKAFDEYEKTGKPPVRALVADYTDDEQTYDIDDEYIFCDNLIVAPLTAKSDSRKVYLPKGRWCDYWTGKEIECGLFDVSTENIPVYRKII